MIRISRKLFMVLKNELNPADLFDKGEWLIATDLSSRDLCREKGEKVAVTRVTFADASEWMIGP